MAERRRLPTYPELAAKLLWNVCWDKPGCPIPIHEHVKGFVDEGGILHWTDRRATRSGIRRFVFTRERWVFRQRARPSWFNYYEAIRQTTRMLTAIGLVEGPQYRARDVARLRAQMVNVPRNSPHREEVKRWLETQ